MKVFVQLILFIFGLLIEVMFIFLILVLIFEVFVIVVIEDQFVVIIVTIAFFTVIAIFSSHNFPLFVIPCPISHVMYEDVAFHVLTKQECQMISSRSLRFISLTFFIISTFTDLPCIYHKHNIHQHQLLYQ